MEDENNTTNGNGNGNGNSDKYRPFEFFKKKQLKEDETKSDDQLKNEYLQLDEETKIKFIKKAESKFDKHNDVDSLSMNNCLSKYLSHDELELLVKSYGLPDLTFAKSAKQFYARNYVTDYGNYNEKLKEFDSLPDKNDILDAYFEIIEHNARNYSKFLDELPKQRFFDYRTYVFNMETGKHPKPKPKHTESPTKSGPAKKSKKVKFKYPFEYHYDKNKDEFKNRIDARKAYGQLKDKKKLKYIKKCEEEFDVNPYFEGKLLSSFLFKDDTQILLDSYGLPKKVPPNLTNFYVQKHYIEVDAPQTERFKICIDRFKNLNSEEKRELSREHEEARAEFEAKIKEFLEKLPNSRKADYESLYGKSSYHNIKASKQKASASKRVKSTNGDSNAETNKHDSIEHTQKQRQESELVDSDDEIIGESNVEEESENDDHDDDPTFKSKARLIQSEILSSENDDKSSTTKSPKKLKKH